MRYCAGEEDTSNGITGGPAPGGGLSAEDLKRISEYPTAEPPAAPTAEATAEGPRIILYVYYDTNIMVSKSRLGKKLR